MAGDLRISLLGELRVVSAGKDVPLPASRKARALLAFLLATGRPHRRERLCEIFWELPDDPKAALRWALSKLRGVVDTPGRPRIVADRERVQFDASDVDLDIRTIHEALRRGGEPVALQTLETMARQLDDVLLDGLDGAGGALFEAWLVSERQDALTARSAVLRALATHPEIDSIQAQKWMRLWRDADPVGADAYQQSAAATAEEAANSGETPGGGRGATPPTPAAGRPKPATSFRKRALRAQRIGFCEAADGTKIAYATIGAGPPLLKAANWLTHLEFDWESPIWGGSFGAIAQGRTFIRYDERGCGLSDWDVDDLSFDAFVEDLEVVADKLGLDRFPLLGISQGAAVSIEYAVRHPERVTGLILLGGYAAGWRHMADAEEQARREAVMALTRVGWGTDNPAYRHIFSQTFMPEASPEDLAWFDDFQRQTTSPDNAARFQDAFGRIDVRHRLAEVRAPTIVLHSSYDQRIPLDQGRDLASGIANARFVPLESSNHVLVDYEPAWRACVDAISDFLAEESI